MTNGPHLSLGALSLLKVLGQRGAVNRPFVTSSREVGVLLGVSQQAADNYLVDLEKKGYVKRALGARKQHITLTHPGLERLKAEYLELKQIFDSGTAIRLIGEVVSGVGEGRYYLSKDGYVRQFKRTLGYAPYPGTLNVRISTEVSVASQEVRNLPGVRIEGFQAEGRTFGGATCYGAVLGGRHCHLILPDRTHYRDVLEFIAEKNLRRTLALKDGDKVEMEIVRCQ